MQCTDDLVDEPEPEPEPNRGWDAMFCADNQARSRFRGEPNSRPEGLFFGDRIIVPVAQCCPGSRLSRPATDFSSTLVGFSITDEHDDGEMG